jgi:SAM-dependent methyltransferase
MEARQSAAPANDDVVPVDFSVYSAFLAYQAPLPLSLVLAMHGLGSGPLSGAFTYAQVGLGDAIALAVLADSYPEAQFIGVDESPAAIERAEALAKAGGLGNIKFIHSPLAEVKLPPCDVIIPGGLYSSAEPEPRARLIKALAGKLKPGGALCVQYRLLPGSATTDALFHFLRQIASTLQGDPLTRLSGALSRAVEMARNGALIFRQLPAAQEILERMIRSDPTVGVREVFNITGHALYFTEVMAEMEAAGLRYVGNGQVLANLLDITIPPPLRSGAEALAEGAARETYLDFVRNNDSRVDIYVRPDGPPPRDMADALGDFLVRRPDGNPETLRRQQLAQNTGIDFTAQLYTDLLAAIKPTPQTISALLDDPALRKHARARVTKAILLALGADMASLMRTPTSPDSGPMPDKVRLVSKLNAHIIAAHLGNPDIVPVSCPVTGQRLVLTLAQRLHLHAMLGGSLDSAFEALSAGRFRLTDKDGNPPTLESFKESVITELPNFRAQDAQFLYAIGVLGPAVRQ